jgi:hypothetical protein
MSIEKRQQDFRFKSTAGGKIVFWICGTAPILLSIGLYFVFLAPRELTGEGLLVVVAVEASLWIFGCMILFSACDIKLLEGQLRFRRVFVWRSVPLESITRVKALEAEPAVYIRVDDGGKRYRLVFYAGDFEESSPPPVIRLLEEACARNREKSDSHTFDMATETARRGFTYESPLSGVVFLWACGILLLSFAAEDIRPSAMPGHWGSHLFLAFAFLVVWMSGSVILSGASDVHIRDGELRFRRVFLASRSVPLSSITRVRGVWFPPSVYVRVDYAGNRYRLIFVAAARFGRVPPVLQFLQEVCKQNAEPSGFHTSTGAGRPQARVPH